MILDVIAALVSRAVVAATFLGLVAAAILVVFFHAFGGDALIAAFDA